MKKAYPLTVPLFLLALGVPFLVRYLNDISRVRQYAMAFLTILFLYFFAVMTFSKGKYKPTDVCLLLAASVYILLGFNGIVALRIYEPGGEFTCLCIFICAWITDIFAYFCGMLLGRGGKHKLIPDVSPKKTVEGAIGGIVFCVIAMILYAFIIQWFSDYSANFLLFAVCGLICSVISQIGDLLMSVIKRAYGIKDYGKIFPGHGGMLDRFDSILAVSVALAVFGSFFDFLEII